MQPNGLYARQSVLGKMPDSNCWLPSILASVTAWHRAGFGAVAGLAYRR